MKTKEIVRELLTIKPHLRDNDNMLIAAYWWKELKRKEIDPNKMKDWKAAVRTWERRETKKPKTMSKLDSQISAWQEAKKLL